MKILIPLFALGLLTSSCNKSKPDRKTILLNDFTSTFADSLLPDSGFRKHFYTGAIEVSLKGNVNDSIYLMTNNHRWGFKLAGSLDTTLAFSHYGGVGKVFVLSENPNTIGNLEMKYKFQTFIIK